MSTTLEPIPAVVDDDDIAARYGIYVLVDGEPQRVAECELDAIGTALVSLANDRREAGQTGAENFGVFDQVSRQWVSGMW